MRAHRRRWLTAGAGILAVLAVLFACAVIVPPSAGGGGPDKPDKLQVNLVSEPMTVPAAQGVYFSWASSDSRPGETQHGYELRVAASAEGLDPAGRAVWDTGTVSGGAAGADYAGPALHTGTRYWWSVRTVDAQGRPSQWSAPAQFGTALGATWQTRAIWSRTPPAGTSSGWAFLRGQLAIHDKPISAATVYATGGSTEATRQYVFRLSVNGQVVGVGPARPLDPANQSDVLRLGRDQAAEGRDRQLRRARRTPPGTPTSSSSWSSSTRTASARCGGPARTGRGSTARAPTRRPAASARSTTPRRSRTWTPSGTRSASTPPATSRPPPPGGRPAVGKTPIGTLTPDTAGNLTLAAHKPVKITRPRPWQVPARLRHHPGRRAAADPRRDRGGEGEHPAAARCSPARTPFSTS